MPNYRRIWQPGRTSFFTVNLFDRTGNDLLVRHIDDLRQVVKAVRETHPFAIHGWVVLPEHLHCVLELPRQETDFATRWRLIKAGFSKAIARAGAVPAARARRGEREIWQRRYWEHLIEDERDYRAHLDYVHINPLKHGLVQRVADWPHSTFHRFVAQGIYPANWAGGDEDFDIGGD